jgi:hypothetical protein
MRFFPHDPEAEFRKGLIFVILGGIVVLGVAAGVALTLLNRGMDGRVFGSGVIGRYIATGVAGAVVASGVVLAGFMHLKEAASLRRERRLRSRAALKVRPARKRG